MKKFLILTTLLLSFVACDNGVSGGVNEKVLTADKAIDNYEWFKMQESQIKSMYKQEEIQQKSLDDYLEMIGNDKTKWTQQDKSHINFLRTVLDGTRIQVNNMIAEYNAKSSMKHKVLYKNNLPTNIVRGIDTKLEFKYDINLYNQSEN